MDVLLFGKNHGRHGPTRVTRGLTKGLCTLGHNVKMITYGDRSDSPDGNIKIESFPLPDESINSWWRMYSSVKDLVESSDYDVFHALERYPYTSDIRTVQWTFDSYIVWRRVNNQAIGFRTIAGDAFLNWMSRNGATKANSIIASSPETKQQMESIWFLSPDTIIPLGIDSDYRSPPSASKSNLTVLFVGRFEQRKGYDRIIPHLNPDGGKFNVRIAGGITDETYAESLLNREWRKHYLGHINDAELENEYESADIVVIPSYLENFSMVALEAISKGCVVIISQGCGFAQFGWAKPENGIYVVSSGQEAVEQINSLVYNSTIDGKKKAAYHLSSQLTWEKIAEKYILKYNEIKNKYD